VIHRRSLGYRLVAAAIACQSDVALAAWLDPLTWSELKQKIRAQFPEVRQMTVAELQRAMLNHPRPVLVDARAREEFEISHLEGSAWAPDLASVSARLAKEGKETLVVVYCSVGWRSSVLARQLMQSGYTHVFNLEGSIFEWANAGLPVYKDGHVVVQVHPYNARWGTLLFSKLRAPI
jgi:rhodanese-related sulfurtransferase